MEAAARFAWLGPDGSVPQKEVGARQVFRYVLAHDLQFLLVDVASAHALECERGEIEPLIASKQRSDSSGPFAAVGRISESMLQAVKPSQGQSSTGGVPAPVVSPDAIDGGAVRPSSVGDRSSTAGATRPGDALPRSVSASSASGPRPDGFTVGMGTVDPSRPSATFGSGGASARLLPLKDDPSEVLLDALVTVLRGYPEVEWASLCLASRGPVEPLPTVALRVDTSYRTRVNDIVLELRRAADAAGASLDVLLLDDPKLMRSARADGLLFFPWKRRGTV
jgi:hypothetical protein